MTATQPETLLTIEPSAQAPRNSEGSILACRDGSLYLAYSRFTGGGHDSSRAQIACRISADGGATWSDDAVAVDTEGAENVMSVSILRLASGDPILFYAVKNGWGDCRLYGRRSTDELRSLGERFCATPPKGYHVVNNDRVVQLSSGRLVVPAALHPCADGTRDTWQSRGISLCYLSDDEGRSWRASTTRLHAPAGSGSGLQEPGVVELGDGRLRLWARTDLGCQYESVSEDGGDTWSPAAPGPLASPVSPVTVRRLPWSGELLAVWNDHSGRHPFPAGKRSPLCLATSPDDGETWRPSRVLEADPEGWYCYTAMTILDDAVLLAYCAGDATVGGLNRLRVTRVPRTWIDA